MFSKHLVTASVATLLATGALAQTNAPGTTSPTAQPQTQTAPAATTRAQQMANEQLTSSKLVGITIYAPKPDAPATTGSTVTRPSTDTSGTMSNSSGAAATQPLPGSGSTAATGPAVLRITPVSDAQWRTMRDGHDSIGKIDDLVIGNDGRITHAVLGVGGFLGMGEKNVAIALADVRFMRMADGTLVGFVSSTKKQLQDMPTFERSRI
ncbi:PRC-barrel domain-containing protein [Phreatobacter sp.]|uniref:PRC-barrel domain-containing protein n=1 Tax=Phreatobacter sp. TaxID=1966341 RepID=UPI0022C7A033|nr:PRC-barrel domain-containing protein [Phreatobacter sp.]MCZ8314238.1 PRC-barrel domain-containing protein [Phreatobacter sp.]